MFLANIFALSDAKHNISNLLNMAGTYNRYDIPLLRKLLPFHQKSWQPSFWEVIDFCFSSICKFGSFKNLFATIISMSEFYLKDSEDLFCWYKWKKWFLWIMTMTNLAKILEKYVWSSFFVNLQACMLIAGTFTEKELHYRYFSSSL